LEYRRLAGGVAVFDLPDSCPLKSILPPLLTGTPAKASTAAVASATKNVFRRSLLQGRLTVRL
jgi:hypothetical protein